MGERAKDPLPFRVIEGGEATTSDARKRDALPDVAQQKRIAEALLFASASPLSETELAEALPESADVAALLTALKEDYGERGVNLVRVAGKWQLRTAEDLRWLLRREQKQRKKLSKAALETLAIIAYHQPVTRAEIEDIRGVTTSKGTLDALMEAGWVKIRGRRQTPGRPVTYGTTEEFLVHFGLERVDDLPGLRELKGAGLLDADIPPDFMMPVTREESLLDAENADDPFAAPEMENEPPLEMHLEDEADH